jgi:hypothetical protein
MIWGKKTAMVASRKPPTETPGQNRMSWKRFQPPANQTSVSEQRNIMPKAKSILPPSNRTSVVQAIILVGKYRMQLPDGSVAKVKY